MSDLQHLWSVCFDYETEHINANYGGSSRSTSKHEGEAGHVLTAEDSIEAVREAIANSLPTDSRMTKLRGASYLGTPLYPHAQRYHLRKDWSK
jgi:hypothetical protein